MSLRALLMVLALLVPAHAFGQGVVSGTVTDSTQSPLDVTILRASPGWPWPEPPQERACVRDGAETASERERRDEATGAMLLIDEVLRTWPALAMPSWEQLAKSPDVARLLTESGARGDLARRIRWGQSEPLPGWGIWWAVIRTDRRFDFVDLRDPGGFRLPSLDPCVIARRGRIVPLETNRQ